MASGSSWWRALASLHSVPGLGLLRRARQPAAPITWVSGAAMAIRRSAWHAAGPFDERFRFYAQDLDLCERAGQLGWGVRLLPGLEVLHHHGATIGRAAGAVARQQPGLLWTDLLRWAIKARPPAGARAAARALKLGARFRLAWRSIRATLLRGDRRAEWRAETAAYRRALDGLNALSMPTAKQRTDAGSCSLRLSPACFGSAPPRRRGRPSTSCAPRASCARSSTSLAARRSQGLPLLRAPTLAREAVELDSSSVAAAQALQRLPTRSTQRSDHRLRERAQAPADRRALHE